MHSAGNAANIAVNANKASCPDRNIRYFHGTFYYLFVCSNPSTTAFSNMNGWPCCVSIFTFLSLTPLALRIVSPEDAEMRTFSNTTSDI
jgi:hypothetical protein